MNQAIKTISLDDVGETQSAELPGGASHALHYSPRYVSNTNTVNETAVSQGAFGNASSTIGQTKEGTIFGTAMTRMTELFGDVEEAKKTRLYFLAGGVVFILLAAVYLTFSNSESLHEGGEDGVTSESAGADPGAGKGALAKSAAPKNEMKATAVPSSTVDPLINPYWSMPNPLGNDPDIMSTESLSANQEERWRRALEHPFTYQRYKTVQEIRQSRLKGSEFLLTEGLSQSKFWTRMSALLAIAELGQELDIDTVEGAIGNTRRSLVANYFRRFRSKASPSALYVMRHAVKVVDASSRQVILANLSRHRDPINDLYLVAASYDPNPKVKTWVQKELAAAPAAEESVVRFKKLLNGEESSQTEPAGKEAGTAEKVEAEPTSINTEEVLFLNEDGAADPPAPSVSEKTEPDESDKEDGEPDTEEFAEPEQSK